MTLKPSVGVQVPPVWPVACARRVKFLSTLALRCRKNRPTNDTIYYVDTFRKHVEFLPRASPNKIVHLTPPAAKFFPLDKDCRVLECHGKSFTLYMRIQLLAPSPPSLHQPAKSLLEVPYPVSLPGISVAIWPSI